MDALLEQAMQEELASGSDDMARSESTDSNVPIPAQQIRLVKDLIDEAEEMPIEAGSVWYLVSSRWINAWIRWCNENPKGSDSEEFPAMDNSALVDEENFHMNDDLIAIKWGVREQRDYITIPESAWSHLQRWYGTEGHIIKRNAYEYAKGETRIEIFLASVDFVFVPSGLEECIQLSHSNTVKDLKEGVRVLLAHKHPKVSVPSELYFYFTLSADAPGSTKYALPDEDKETEGKMLEEVGLLTQDARLFVDDKPWPDACSLTAASEPVDEAALKPGAGLVGLRNLGNTCFMNSALQCLLNCDPLRRFILSGQYAADINKTNRLGTGGVLLAEFAALLRTVWSAEPHSVVDPLSFKYALGRFEGRFLGYAQQDSQEFLSALLDRVHEDLNRVKEKPYTETPERAGRPDSEVAAEAWGIHRRRNDSAIVDLFHGQLKSTVTCPTCSQVSVTFDPFLFLSLPLPSRRPRSLRVLVLGDELADQVDIVISAKKDRTIAGLKIAVLARAGLSSEKHTVHIAEVYNGQVYRSFNDDDESLVNIKQPGDDIQACIVPKDRPAAWFIVGVGEAKIGFPLLIPLKANPEDFEESNDLESMLKASVLAFAQNPRLEPERFALDGPFESKRSPIPIYKLQVDPDFFLPFMQDIQETEDVDRQLVAFHHLFLARHHSLPSYKSDGSARDEVGLYECLDLFVQEERLSPSEDWYCSRCKAHQEGAGKKLDLWKLPEILVVHLKRFAYDSYYGHKISTPVAFPVE